MIIILNTGVLISP